MELAQEDIGDIHICGRCEQQFTDYLAFVEHKKQHTARTNELVLQRDSMQKQVYISQPDSLQNNDKNVNSMAFSVEGSPSVDLHGHYSNAPCQAYEEAGVIMTEAQFHSDFPGYTVTTSQSEVAVMEEGGERVVEMTRLSPGSADGQVTSHTYTSMDLIDKEQVNGQQLPGLHQPLDEANTGNISLGTTAVFGNVIMDVDGTKILTSPAVNVIENNCTTEDARLSVEEQDKDDHLVSESSILLAESGQEEYKSLNSAMGQSEFIGKGSLGDINDGNRSALESLMPQGSVISHGNGMDDGATTLSTTGNIQITLTPSGIQLAVQSLPPNVQAALQSGLERGINASPSLNTQVAYENRPPDGPPSQETPPQQAPSTPSVKSKMPTGNARKYACKHEGCKFTTNYQKDLDRHSRKHTGERPFVCHICSKDFTRSDKLKMHVRAHSGIKPFSCTECNYATTDGSSLKKHVRTHTGERPFKCQICPYASRNSSQLVVHLRTHTGDCPYVCYICNAKFKINSDLKRHMMLHTGEKPYKCDFCHYKCAIKSNLKTHYRINHNEQDIVTCNACDFRTSSRKAFREHMRIHDPSRDVFKCSQCTFTTSTKVSFKAHVKTHSSDKLFKCGLCSFSAKQSGNVTIHFRRKHPGKTNCVKRRVVSASAADQSRDDTEVNAEVLYPADEASVAVKTETRRGKPPSKVRPVCKKFFECPQCKASFVREDSLRCHMKCHQQSDKMMSTALAVLQLQYPVDNSRAGQQPATADINSCEMTAGADSQSVSPAAAAEMGVHGQYTIAPSHSTDTVACYVVNGSQAIPVSEAGSVQYAYATDSAQTPAPPQSDLHDLDKHTNVGHVVTSAVEVTDGQHLLGSSEVTYSSTSEPGSHETMDEKGSVSVLAVTNSSHILHTALVQSNISAEPLILPHHQNHASFQQQQHVVQASSQQRSASSAPASSRSPTRSTMSQSAHRIMAYMQNSQNLAVEENMHNLAAINRQAADDHAGPLHHVTSAEYQANDAHPLVRNSAVSSHDAGLGAGMTLAAPPVTYVSQPASAQPGTVIMELGTPIENATPLAGPPLQIRPLLPSQMYALPGGEAGTMDNSLLQNVQSALPIHVLQPAPSASTGLPMQLLVPVSMGTAASMATPLYTTSVVGQVGSGQLVANSALSQAWSLQIPVDTDGLPQPHPVRGMSYEIIQPVTAAESEEDETTTATPEAT